MPEYSNKDDKYTEQALPDSLESKNLQHKDSKIWVVKKEKRFFNIPVFQVKESLNTERVCIFGIPVFSFQRLNDYDYKRKKIKVFGVKITYKNSEWLKEASERNLVQNQKNLSYEFKSGKNLLFVASYFVESGGIETRLLQYIKQLQNNGWNIYLLSENNLNKNLRKYTNFYLNFDGDNVQQCLDELIDKYHINCIEFQFKPSKILKNFDIDNLKKKVRLGCCIHNIGVKDTDKINQFDYSIMVSGQMFEHHYKNVKNSVIIKNAIETSDFENAPMWQYKGQKTAVLISRIAKDKLESIECFIKYCQDNKIPFIIAGEEQYKDILKNKLIKKYKLDKDVFIGRVNTIEYLKQNPDNILFVAGVGQVIFEGGILGYPVFVTSSHREKCYSFVTTSNFDLFDNFTIKSYSPVTKAKKKIQFFDINKSESFNIAEKLKKERNIDICIKKYLTTIGDINEK